MATEVVPLYFCSPFTLSVGEFGELERVLEERLRTGPVTIIEKIALRLWREHQGRYKDINRDDRRYTVTLEGEDPGPSYTLAELVEANEDMADEIREAVRDMRVGETETFGGGAAPVCTIQREPYDGPGTVLNEYPDTDRGQADLQNLYWSLDAGNTPGARQILEKLKDSWGTLVPELIRAEGLLREAEEDAADRILVPADDDCMGCGEERVEGHCVNPSCTWERQLLRERLQEGLDTFSADDLQIQNANTTNAAYEERYGTSDVCPKGGEHEADEGSLAPSHEAPGVVDLWCRKCGRSGSYPTDKPEDLLW